MATRANIQINNITGKGLWLYRHWDGYPAETGVHIAQTLKKLTRGYALKNGKGVLAVVNALMLSQYEATKHKPASLIYELTDSEHGDIEWRYDIKVKPSGVVVTVHEYSFRTEQWTTHEPMNLKAFRSYCAGALAAQRRRARDIRQQHKQLTNA